MTAKKDLKRRIRERQTRTGESYTTARARVVAQGTPDDEHEAAPTDSDGDLHEHEPAPTDSDGDLDEHADATAGEPKPPAISVVELVDHSEDATKLGLKCNVLVSPSLATRISPVRVLERLRDALIATEQDPATQLLRAVVLRGETVPLRDRRRMRAWWDDTRRFLVRARAGIGGTTTDGDMLALHVDGVLVIVQVGYVPNMPPIPRTRQRVFLTSIEGHQVDETLLRPS